MRMPTEDFDRVLAVNLRGVFLTCRGFARAMLRARRGRIINVGSIVGLTGNAGQANYAAAKAGLVGFTKSVAQELASRGVTANVVAPGFIDTDMTSGLPEEVKAGALRGIPAARFGAADDVAGAVLFLASDLAAYVCGQVLVVDGGMAM
jgi:3-oxoacyl-[acyl-carrier protein] reductase